MKLLILAAFAALAMPVQATNKPDPSSRASAGARAKAGARASIDNLTVNGAGGFLTYGRDSDFYALPAPAFVPQLPSLPKTTCVDAANHARSLGWSFASDADGYISPDKCIAIDIYNAFVQSCRYMSANQVLDLLIVKVLPGFTVPRRNELIDLSPSECRSLHHGPIKTEMSVLPSGGDRAASASEVKTMMATDKKTEEIGPKQPKKDGDWKKDECSKALATAQACGLK